jgi:large subunit ribosomal protein L4
LSTFEIGRGLIVDVANENLSKSARNLDSSSYMSIEGLNVYDVLKHETLLMTQAAVEQLEGRLTK